VDEDDQCMMHGLIIVVIRGRVGQSIDILEGD